MKNIFLVAALLATFTANACDVCSMYLVINPTDYRNSFQLNYRFRSAEALVKQGFLNQQMHIGSGYFSEDTFVEEYFTTYDAWGNFFLNERLQLSVNLPYNIAENYFNDSLVQEASGLGDVSALLLYQVHNTMSGADTDFRQRFSVGGGVKLPTGNYKMILDDEPVQPEYQPGTGSIDFLVNAQYIMRFKNWGGTANALYQLNGENNLGYAFANGFNGAATVFYQWQTGDQTVIMPEVGLFHEFAERDTENGVHMFGTGGSSTFAQYGLRTFLGDFALSGYYFYPVNQSLNDFQLSDNPRVTVSLQYTFAGKGK